MKLNLLTTLKKGVLAALTFGVAFITPNLVLNLVPDSIENMTVGAVIAALVVAVTNIIKVWTKK